MQEPTQLLNQQPFIGCYPSLISSEACQSLINLARGQLTPATVVGQSGLEVSHVRISELAWFCHNYNEVVQSICKQIAEIVEQPIHYAEKLQVAHYGAGGKFEAHLDCYDSQEANKPFLEHSGQRLYTAILYLNDVVSGGETYFPNLKIEVSPTTGTLLVFENCQPDTSIPDLRSLHGSKILQSGEKWIGTLWFCERPQYQV
ncbi:prolyl hydroxylase family protein [Brevibacillus laterosporus]|uniref:2OG-Fe(II) oxygenase superfamily protein n=1 Tax=Brevibacillus laterosporus LMG 15441 TaxID=1042163 RepID=A0A075R630_BRELA|nr:2OG-Fe(II) oxygenase [Brevibacillus laterosporus]AIG26618.1 2OG-Fe(II) oxygenase superfamily protein [Brevibacillus laterosporus LMG 15441]MDF9413896.1 2OG-Fe(II) oxygenase [Brevibacillus laterosporus]RJL14133.1 2OG-Fe(II) oxygenase [Brevibacillus laterosporus]